MSKGKVIIIGSGTEGMSSAIKDILDENFSSVVFVSNASEAREKAIELSKGESIPMLGLGDLAPPITEPNLGGLGSMSKTVEDIVEKTYTLTKATEHLDGYISKDKTNYSKQESSFKKSRAKRKRLNKHKKKNRK